MDVWIRTTADIDANNYVIGQAMANNLRYQKVHCFICGRQVHLKRDCRQSIPRHFSRRAPPSEICKNLVVVGIEE